MALLESFESSGNWLFRWRSYLPLVLYVAASGVLLWGPVPDAQDLERWGTFEAVCLAVSLSGLLVRALTIGYTPRGTSGRNTSEGQVAESLNTRGIYGMVRHPLYVGNFLMWIGLVMYLGSWGFTVIVALSFWLYYERIMFAEEAFLRRKFGQSYVDWSLKTPAFIPRWGGWQPAGVPFSLRNVFKREYNGFLAVFLTFAWISWMQSARGLAASGGDWTEARVQSIWLALLGAALVVFLLLRTLKKHTRMLDVPGREYVNGGGEIR
jgi:protein-S-isoprenylcysteine O-methyltransferase Ste14